MYDSAHLFYNTLTCGSNDKQVAYISTISHFLTLLTVDVEHTLGTCTFEVCWCRPSTQVCVTIAILALSLFVHAPSMNLMFSHPCYGGNCWVTLNTHHHKPERLTDAVWNTPPPHPPLRKGRGTSVIPRFRKRTGQLHTTPLYCYHEVLFRLLDAQLAKRYLEGMYMLSTEVRTRSLMSSTAAMSDVMTSMQSPDDRLSQDRPLAFVSVIRNARVLCAYRREQRRRDIHSFIHSFPDTG